MIAKINRRHFIASGSAVVAMPFLSRAGTAQGAWPSRQIRMVCSYPAGGQTDLLARAFGEFIGKQTLFNADTGMQDRDTHSSRLH